MNLNLIFLNDIYNKHVVAGDLGIGPLVTRSRDNQSNRMFNRDLRTFSINLGRRSGKTTSISNFIKLHPELKFVIFVSVFNEGSRYKLSHDLEGITNVEFFNISRTQISSPYFDVAFLDDSELVRINSSDINKIENIIYQLMNNNTSHQIYFKLG